MAKLFLAGLLLAAGALCAAAGAPAQAPEQPKRILILYDEDQDEFPGLARIDRTLRDHFRGELGKGAEVHSESLALSRFERPGYDARLAEFYREKYQAAPPDVIVAVMEPSLDFLLRHGDTLFAGVPIVFTGVDASTIAGKQLPANVTGALLKRTFAPTVEVALALQPEARNVYVVGGVSTFDRYLEKFVRRDLEPFEGRVAITYLFGQSMDEWLVRLSTLPANSFILYTSVFADGAGRRFVPHEAVATIAASANAPVYVFIDQFVGLGPVGGNVYSVDLHGAHVAALATQVLRGTPPASLPIRELGAQVNLFDARQLARWNLDAARLPPGSVVRHREPSVWESYRWYIVAAFALMLTQGALIGGLLLARSRQRRAEAEARRQRDDLAHVLRVTTLGELTTSLAHEISQPVAAILLNSQAVAHLLQSGKTPDSREVAEAMADIAHDAEHASHVIQRLRALFRKERVEHVPVDVSVLVNEAVRLLKAAMLIERVDIRVSFGSVVPTVSGDPVQLEQVLLNVLLNACEAIGAKPGGPRTITIVIDQQRRGHVKIEVADTGIGVHKAELEHIFEHFVSTKPKGLGMGLAISRSIINAHGGSIWATANAAQGLTVHIELPCAGEVRADAASASGSSAATAPASR